jgi:hypothetical protein
LRVRPTPTDLALQLRMFLRWPALLIQPVVTADGVL